MKKLLLALLLTSFGAHAAHAQSALLGRWKAEDNDGHIEIYQKGAKYYGKLLNTPVEDGKPKLDKKNPVPAMRSNTLHGTNILVGFEKVDDNEFENGTIYDPTTGKSYKGRIVVKGKVMELRGFIGSALFGKTVIWRRAG